MHERLNSPTDQFAAIRWIRYKNSRAHVKRLAGLFLLMLVNLGLGSSEEIQRQMQRTTMQSAMLEGHNSARQQVGLPPVVWSPTLAANATGYAVTMARSRRFAHSPNELHGPQQGENLWMGTRNAYTFAEMVGLWVNERQVYDGGSINESLARGTFQKTGHYTQIIWRNTKEIGCAVSSNVEDDYLVCRYLPAGNIKSESPLD